MSLFMRKIKKATGIGCVTLMGYVEKQFPMKDGNCFSVHTSTGEDYRIVNFNYENFKELLNNRGLTFPVKILPISEKQAIIYDERISAEWYSTHFCTVCCPEHLLPLPQRIQKMMKKRRGEIKVIDCGEFKIERYDFK